MLTIKEETFEGTFPFAPQYYDGAGFEMHYVDVGSGEPVVMLHGDPTWGYLYRNFIGPLAQQHRCIVPDHMGMGKSAVPQDRSLYRLEQHVSNLEALLLHLDLHNITLVLHDWGGPVGLGFATRHPERIKRLVLMNTWAFAPWPGGPFPRLLELIRSERGEAFVLKKNGYLEPALLLQYPQTDRRKRENLMPPLAPSDVENSTPTMPTISSGFTLETTHHPEHPKGVVKDAYKAPFPTPESRIAMLCWSRDIPVQESDVSYAEMKRIERALPQFSSIPILLIWDMRDPVLSVSVLQEWQRVYPHAKTCELEDASHFLQEDAPAQIVQELEAFLEETP